MAWPVFLTMFSSLSLGNVLLLFLFLLMLHYLMVFYEFRNMPPGPRLTALPVLGNILSLNVKEERLTDVFQREAVRRKKRLSGYGMSTAQPPCFGLDIGGTLAKLVYFVPLQSPEGQRKVGLEALKDFIEANVKFGEIGTRDESLAVNSVVLGEREGYLRFVHFPNDVMEKFLLLAKEFNALAVNTTVGATGGGAFKFEGKFQEILGIQLEKYNEFECLVRGLHFINSCCADGFYYWNNPQSAEEVEKVPYNFDINSYPYLVVTVGSGVSVVLVQSADKFRTISGTSIGGGTFLGLCCLLTGCSSFQEALSMAEEGDSSKVDNSIQDLYGGDYATTAFNMPADITACSFGKMCCKRSRSSVNHKDVAKALLVTVTNNTALIARTCAASHKIDRVLFAGGFLRGNTMATKLLASTMNNLSRGNTKALFLKHEGYCGASGALFKFMKSIKATQNTASDL